VSLGSREAAEVQSPGGDDSDVLSQARVAVYVLRCGGGWHDQKSRGQQRMRFSLRLPLRGWNDWCSLKKRVSSNRRATRRCQLPTGAEGPCMGGVLSLRKSTARPATVLPRPYCTVLYRSFAVTTTSATHRCRLGASSFVRHSTALSIRIARPRPQTINQLEGTSSHLFQR